MRDKIIQFCAINRITVGESQARLLDTYMDYMLEYNKHTNLTAILEPDEFIMKHFVDSLSLLEEIGPVQEGTSLVDIGSGAGLPGIPLAIMLPQMNVVMVEATGKKVNFINSAIELLGLGNAKAVWGRAEELSGVGRDMREAYDISVGRAVASLPVMMEYCSPFTKPGGRLLAMKGPKTHMEPGWNRAAHELALDFCHMRELSLVWEDQEQTPINRQIYTFKKTKNLSPKYPRKTGKAAKEPIC